MSEPTKPTARRLVICFDGPPGHECGRFVEVEDGHGHSIRAGEWRESERYAGQWELDLTAEIQAAAQAAREEERAPMECGHPRACLGTMLSGPDERDTVGTAGTVTCFACAREARARRELQAIVDAQAKDAGLWFKAETAPEAYLQLELRRLHAAIERGERSA